MFPSHSVGLLGGETRFRSVSAGLLWIKPVSVQSLTAFCGVKRVFVQSLTAFCGVKRVSVQSMFSDGFC